MTKRIGTAERLTYKYCHLRNDPHTDEQIGKKTTRVSMTYDFTLAPLFGYVHDDATGYFTGF